MLRMSLPKSLWVHPSLLAMAISAVAFLPGTAASAQAQSLFNAPSSTAGIPQPARQRATLRARNVVVNNAVMASAFAKRKKSRKALEIELFPGLNVTVQPDNVDPGLGEGAVSWSGRLAGIKNGFATLVQRDDGIVGQVQIGAQTFKITPKSAGVHTISQVVPEALKDDIAIPSPGSLRARPLVAPVPAPTAGAQLIRVLVVFTDRANTQATAAGSNMRDEALLAIATANASYFNTALRAFRLRFAGLRAVGCRYDETAGSYSQILYDITNGSTCIGRRAGILRDQRSADLVAVLRGSGSYCGVAWVNENPAGQSRYGFSVTSRTCISNHSFTHELGHNMGLQHDRYVSSGTQAESNFGFVSEANRIRSIMAYNRKCSDQGFNCSRVQVFSNTVRAAQWSGVKMGRSLRQSDPADNRSMLLRNWSTIAAWR